MLPLLDATRECGICQHDGPRRFPHLHLTRRPFMTEIENNVFGNELVNDHGDDMWVCFACRMELNLKHERALREAHYTSLLP